MALPAYIALNYRDGTTPQIQRYQNSTATSIGVTFGALDNMGTNPTIARTRARVINVGGSHRFLAYVGGTIYRSTDGTASWTNVHTLSVQSGNQQGAVTGLHILYKTNGTEVVAMLYRDTGTNTYRAAVSTDQGDTWNEYGPFGHSGFGNFTLLTHSEMIFQGALAWGFCLGSGQTSANLLGIFDPNTNAVSFVDDAIRHFMGPQLVGFNGSLYRAGYENNQILVRQFLGPSWSTAAAIPAVGDQPDELQMAAWVKTIGGNQFQFLFVLYRQHNNGVWSLAKFDTSFNRTDVSSIVPAGLVSLGTTGRAFVIYDTESAPNTEPDVYVIAAPSAASSSAWSLYKFIDDVTLMTVVEVGTGNAAHALPAVFPMGGEHFWSSGERALEVVAKEVIRGGERIHFKVYSDTGTDLVTVKWRHALSTKSYATNLGSISNQQKVGPAPLPGLSANSLTNVTADNGATIYSFDWDAATDGYGTNDRARTRLELS